MGRRWVKAMQKAVAGLAAATLSLSMMPAAALAYVSEGSAAPMTAATFAGAGGALGGDAQAAPDAAQDIDDDGQYALVYTQDEASATVVGFVRLDAQAALSVEPGDALKDVAAGNGGLSAQALGTQDDDGGDDDGDGGEEEFVYTWDSAAKPNPDVEIPAAIGGKPVTAIADGAFEGAAWINSVTMHEGVTRIGRRAFYGCAKLTSVTLPSTLQTIGGSAFYGCSSLAAISVPSGCFLGSYAFQSCSSLASVTLGEGVTCVRDDYGYEYSSYGVFSSCYALTSISLPGSVGIVGSFMFNGCSQLKSIVLGEGITALDDYAFEGCRPASTLELPESLTKFGRSSLYWWGDGYWDEDNQYVSKSTYTIQPATWAQYYALQNNSTYINTNTTTVLEPSGAVDANVTFETQLNSDDTLTVTGISGGYPAQFVIPDTLDYEGAQKKVSAIGDAAFKDGTWMESVVIPASIASIGDGAFRSCVGLKAVSVPQNCLLGSYAFADCSALTDIVLGEGVSCAVKRYNEHGEWDSETGEWAYVIDEDDYYLDESYSVFRNCKSLKQVMLPGSLGIVASEMFYGCAALEEVVIGEGMTMIAPRAFDYCVRLASVSIPGTVTSIGSWAFAYCYQLASFTLPTSLESLGEYAFDNCTPSGPVSLPASLTSIGEWALCWYGDGYWDDETETRAERKDYQITPATWKQYWQLQNNHRYINTSSTTVMEPSGVGMGQFKLLTSENGDDGTVTITGVEDGICKDLVISNVLSGKVVTAIAEGAFEDATWLESIQIPDSVKSIGGSAFRGCIGLKKVSVPPSCFLGSYAFADCSALADIELGEGVSCAVKRYNERWEWDSESGEGKYVVDEDDYWLKESDGVFQNCDSLKRVTLPGSLGVVASNMFYTCDALEEVVIGEGVTKVGSEAFQSCNKLASVSIPKTVTSIGSWAFAYCYQLSSAALPDSVTSMGSYAFESCSQLSSLALPSSLESLGEYAFSGCKPSGLVSLPASLTSIGKRAFSWYGSGYWDDDAERWVSQSFQIATATWRQYWQLQDNPNYINTESTTVLPPTANMHEVIVFKIKVNADGTATITGTESKTANLKIPAYVSEDGKAADAPAQSGASTQSLSAQDASYKVTAIGKDAFKGDQVLQSVEIPDTVTTIEEGAFANCPVLDQVAIPDSVTAIDASAFEGAGGDTGIEFICDPGSAAATFANAASNVKVATTASLESFGEATPSKSEVAFSPTGVIERPSIAVSALGKQLQEGTHYTLEYSPKVIDSAGPVVVTAKAIDGSGYSGETWCSYTVAKADLAQATMTPIPDQVFDDEEITPHPTVTMEGVVLSEGTDYTLSYEDNDRVGTAIVTATGRNNYTGEVSTEFHITSQAVDDEQPQAEEANKDGDPAETNKPNQDAGKSNETDKPTQQTKADKPASTGAGGSVSGNTTLTTTPAVSAAVASPATTAKSKSANPMKVKAQKKTLKAAALAKKAKTLKVLQVTKAKGKVTFKNVSKKKLKAFKVNKKTGKITVPKNTKAGIYKIKVQVRAVGNNSYKAATKTVTAKIVVK